MRVWEPIGTGIVCAWIAYNALEEAKQQAAAAAICGALLVASCFVSTAALVAGLAWGGAWREMPTSVPWDVMICIEMAPILLHSAILTQWSRLLGRVGSTPVWAMLHTLAANPASHLLTPGHTIFATCAIFFHQCAMVGYEAMTAPDWASPARGGSLRWIDPFLVMFEIAAVFLVAWFNTIWAAENKRRLDYSIHTRAKVLHDVAKELVTNFLPPTGNS